MADQEKQMGWIGIGGLLLGALTLGWTMYSGRVPLQVSPQSQFICALRPDPNSEIGQQVWTVLYERPDKPSKEWLYMVEEMGDDWNTDVRCFKIANRMNTYNDAGLLSFDYRPDANTPGQWVICARTRMSQDCPLVVTLVPGDETEAMAALQRVAGALMPGNPGSYQTSAEITLEQPASIPLTGLLAED